MGKDGVMYTSKLISVSGKKYYIGSDCVAYKSKFASLSGKKYYFGSDCAMVISKLITVDSKKYYMGSDGVMYTSKLASIDGKKYHAIRCDYKYGLLRSVLLTSILVNIPDVMDCSANCIQKSCAASYIVLIVIHRFYLTYRNSVIQNLCLIIEQKG